MSSKHDEYDEAGYGPTDWEWGFQDGILDAPEDLSEDVEPAPEA